MIPLPLETIADYAGGTLHGHSSARVSRVCTDTRRIQPGDLFIAIKGDKFNGHLFAAQAATDGAAAVLACEPLPNCPIPVIQVTDTILGLQTLATRYLQNHPIPAAAITGSNGKTSTKDFSKAVLGSHFEVLATWGNLNNHIGVPLTVLELDSSHSFLIAEMGMNHAGELHPLVRIVRPTAAILTNVGTAHIEHLGSTENIAWEKATIPTHTRAAGSVILNAEDAYTPRIARLCQARVITAGIDQGDVRASNLQFHPGGSHFTLHLPDASVPVELPVLGRHMVLNATLAAALGHSQGISAAAIAQALSQASLTGGRLQPKTAGNLRFLDDSYNANPDSMAAGLRTLMENPAHRHIAVLGAMGELGPHAVSAHQQIGQLCASLRIDILLTVGSGNHAHEITEAALRAGLHSARHFADHATCAAHLQSLATADDLILIKGSRSSGMEQIITLLA